MNLNRSYKERTVVKMTFPIWCICVSVVISFCACSGHDALDDATDAILSTDANKTAENVSLSAEPTLDLAFSLSFVNDAAEEEATTRMSRERTQADGHFNDIDYLHIIPFGDTTIDEDTQPWGAKLDLMSNITHEKKTTTFKNDDNKNITKYIWTRDLYSVGKVPFNTKSFLVYARPASSEETPPEPAKVFYAKKEKEFASGSLKTTGLYTALDKVGSITFTPDKIYQGETETTYNAILTTANEVAAFMTRVANASYEDNGTTVHWYDITTGTAKTLLNTFTHDGYIFYPSITNILSQLSSICSNGSLDSKIKTAIVDVVNNETNISNTRGNYTFTVNETSSWYGFPQDNRLPNGMFVFKWVDDGHKFVVLDGGNTNMFIPVEDGEDQVILNPSIAHRDLIAYPSELWYYTFSPIRTLDRELTDSEISTIFKSNTWPPSNSLFYENAIYERTRTVAIDKSLNYGVSCLRVNAKTNAATINNVTAANIQITGIMISHQRSVGYNFQPVPKSDDPNADDPYFIVYDKYASNVGQRNITLEANNAIKKNNFNVLVLPSRLNEKVYVIAEFKLLAANTVIRTNACEIVSGDRFYAVGLLDPEKANSNSTGKNQIFQSDRYTSAVLTLRSFDAVYSYVPDVTSPPLTLGLEVELDWQQADPTSVWLN